MGLFSKMFKGPQIDMEKSNRNAAKMRELFNQHINDGDNYQLTLVTVKMFLDLIMDLSMVVKQKLAI